MQKPAPSIFQNIFKVPPEHIYEAIKSGDLESLIDLITSRLVPPQIELKEAFTLAMPHPAIFKILLDTYRCNHVEILGGALQYAAKSDNHAIVRLLLEYLNRDDIYFPVYPELQKQYPGEMIEHLINKGMALIYASESGHLEALDVLLKDKSIRDLATWCENTALRRAQKKQKNATTNEEKIVYNQIICQLINVTSVAQLAAQQGEIFETLDPCEKDKCPLLFTFQNIQSTSTEETLNPESQSPSPSGNCRIS